MQGHFEGDKTMPLYLYECIKCNKEFEIHVPLKYCDDILHCEHCDEVLWKVMAPAYFTIK
jgi:putative FmdB family regulatory protein